MTTPVTPVFQLPYLANGEPLYLMRARVQAALFALETILQSKAVSPPGASDLATLAGRVTALEADQSAEDTLRAVQAPTFGANWAQWTGAPFGEKARVWKDAPDTVRVVGMVMTTVAIAAGVTTDVMTLPLGYRPAVQLVRHVSLGGSTATAPATLRMDVTTGGVVQILCASALTLNQFAALDLTFRTVNT